MRFVGKKQAHIVHYKLQTSKGGKNVWNEKMQCHVFHNAILPPYVPKSYQEPLHQGGNSVCFTIQHAHLMGADPIYLVGFTLQQGSGYAFGGRENPIHGRPPFYEVDRALDWLRFYESRYPGRVRLDPTFAGPIYDVFQVDHSLGRGDDEAQHESDAQGGDVSGVEQLQDAGPGEPVRRDEEQPGETSSVREQGQGS